MLGTATMVPQGPEHRKSPRRWTNRTAEVLCGADKLHCTVVDLSDGGARLAMAAPLAGLPRTFTLALFKDGSLNRDCEVVWTNRLNLGVKFISGWYAALTRDATAKRRSRGAA
jgi:hypothetical protein